MCHWLNLQNKNLASNAQRKAAALDCPQLAVPLSHVEWPVIGSFVSRSHVTSSHVSADDKVRNQTFSDPTNL